MIARRLSGSAPPPPPRGEGLGVRGLAGQGVIHEIEAHEAEGSRVNQRFGPSPPTPLPKWGEGSSESSWKANLRLSDRSTTTKLPR